MATARQTQEWLDSAKIWVKQREDDAYIIDQLVQSGCSPRQASQILKDAHSANLMRKRLEAIGFSVFGIFLVWLAGYASGGLHDGVVHGRAAGQAAILSLIGKPLGWIFIVGGIVLAIFAKRTS